MVKLGRTYKVLSLFVEGCAALVKEDYSPDELDDLALALGWDFAARIMWITSSRTAHSRSIVGLPPNMTKCLQCSAVLLLHEFSQPSSPASPVVNAHTQVHPMTLASMGPPSQVHPMQIQQFPPLFPPPAQVSGPGMGPQPTFQGQQMAMLQQSQQQLAQVKSIRQAFSEYPTNLGSPAASKPAGIG